MTYAIVLFIKSNSLSVVPLSWVKKDKCYWPPGKNSAAQKIVVAGEKALKTWEKYDVRILSIFDTYEDARRHEAKAVETDDILTDHENLGRGCRKKRTVSSSSSEDFNINTMVEYPTPPEAPLSRLSNESYIDIPVVEEPPSQRYTIVAEKSSDHSNQVTINEVKKELIHIKIILKEQNDMLTTVMSCMSKLLENGTGRQTACKENTEPFPMALPVRTEEELECLERLLDVGEHREQLTSLLSMIGGISLGNCTRRILSKVLENQVAELFSWLGLKKKRSFISLKISKIVLDAVRRNKQFESCKDAEIENVIGDWLRHAKARSKNTNVVQ